MNPLLKEIIELGFRRSRKQSFIVGIILFLFSLFWLDSSLENSTLLIKISFSLLIALFLVVSIALFYVGLFKISKQKNNLINILENNKNEVQKIHYYRVLSKMVNKNDPNPPGSQHYIQITLSNSSVVQLAYPFEKISEALNLLYDQVPHTRQ